MFRDWPRKYGADTAEWLEAIDGDWWPSITGSGCIGGVGGRVILGLLTIAGP